MNIRKEKTRDYNSIYAVVKTAFDSAEYADGNEQDLVEALRKGDATEPLCICGLSLGALLALDFTIRHGNKVDSLVLIGAQYKVPTLLIDFQNLLFRCMPASVLITWGYQKVI